MLASSGPWFSCFNAIHCSSSSKHLCTLHTGTASWRVLSIFIFKAVRKTLPTVPTAVGTTCLPKRNSLPVMPFECYPVNCPLLPSLPLEPTPRGWQPQGTTCFMVAIGFLHPVEPQAPLPPGYPADYTNCIADPAHDANCLTVSDCARSSLNWW